MHTAERTPSARQEEIVKLMAERFDTEGVRKVAERSGRIAEIGNESRLLLQKAANGNGYEGMIQGAKGGDGSATAPPQAIAPELSEQVMKEVDVLEQQRMEDVEGDKEVQVRVLEEGVGGVYDGEEAALDVDVVSDETRKGVNRVFKHERQHKEDGISGDIDAPLIQPTGNTEIDAVLPDTTKRDVLEKRAMVAEGAPPRGSYVEEHWEPTVELERKIDETGLSGAKVLRDLIEKDDVAGFEQARNAILLRQLMMTASN